jgi:Cu/Ag efflux pump CusA
MPTTQLSQLIPVLQTAIGPVILISGVGLLLLSLTNRFGRAVDRARQLLREKRDAPEESRQRLAAQVENLYHRARLIQRAIVFSTVSLLFAAVLIIALFFTALMKLELAIVISVLFMCCLASLIISLIAFMMDIRLSLLALKMELGQGESGTAT